MVSFFIRNRWLHFFFLFVLLLALAFGVSPRNETRQRLSFLAFDQYYKNYSREPTDLVKIIDIDDISLSKVGQWPWSRTVVADVVLNLTEMGAKVIAFDGVLAEPDRTSPRNLREILIEQNIEASWETLPDYDQILAEAIAQSGIFVTAFTHGSNDRRPKKITSGSSELIRMHQSVKERLLENSQFFTKTALFLENLEASAAGNGSFIAKPEIDGLIRRTGLIFSDHQELYPSLNVEAYRVYKKSPFLGIARVKEDEKFAGLAEYKMAIGGQEVPVDADGNLWVYFRKFDRSRDYISAYKIIDPAFRKEVRNQVEGRILFIGSSAEGLKDLRATPLDPFLPGVEIHANVVEQFLQGKYLFRPESKLDEESGFILAVGTLMIVLAPFVNTMWIALIFFASTILIAAGSWLGFVNNGLLLDPVYPGLSVFLLFVASVFLTYIRTEAERKQVKQAFGLYISPDFMKELTKDPDKLRLGGETRELTVMFTDIRSFTSISETMSPEELIQLMNDFLTPMSDLVMSHRGTIDKYMGDAMMAFWNAPLDDPDHARNACKAALQMNISLRPINDMLKVKAEAERREPLLLKAGIGINTGPASVGNMGSRQRFAYSALGDTVNLASRIEGQTKYYGMSIMIGLETQKAVPDFATLEADLIRVKGKQEPVRLYGLIGDEEYTKQDFWGPWHKAHMAMIAAYRARDFDGAERLIKECLGQGDPRLRHFYALYQGRIDLLKAEPPPADWDGVYVATSK